MFTCQEHHFIYGEAHSVDSFNFTCEDDGEFESASRYILFLYIKMTD